MSKHRRHGSFPGLAFVIVLGALAAASWTLEAAAERLPWALRDHYTFRAGDLKLQYAVENAEWGVTHGDDTRLVDDAHMSVTLADGTVLGKDSFGGGVTRRERFQDPLGNGIRYIIERESDRGLSVRHSLYTNRATPFFKLTVDITNDSGEPIAISAITPVALGAHSLPGLSPAADVITRPLSARGQMPLYDNGNALSVLIHDPERHLSLALYAAPEGKAHTAAEFSNSGGAWEGEIVSRFEPALSLAPGESLSADPVWLSFTGGQPAGIAQAFAYAQGVLYGNEAAAAPHAWISGPEGIAANALYSLVRAWNLAEVEHVLVPGSWEEAPGSLQGNRPDYPRNMADVASEIRSLGKTPGVTVNLGPAQDGGAEWAVADQDGLYWRDLSHPQGFQDAARYVAELAGMGFSFFTVQTPDIPDDALSAMNITRAKAATLALRAALAGAGGRTVLPAAEASLGNDLSAWLEAAGASSRLGEYGLPIGPVRFEGGAVDQNGVAVAMSFYGGPIEIVAQPDAAPGLAQAFPRRPGRPLDASKAAPRVWETPLNRLGDSLYGSAVVMFPGAPGWPTADVPLDGGPPAKLWRADNGETFDGSGSLPPAESLTVYGATSDHPRPILVGALNGATPHANTVQGLTWDAASGVLRGRVSGPQATAYVYVPDAWRVASAQAGGRSISPSANGNLVAFDIGGQNTPFELSFQRR